MRLKQLNWFKNKITKTIENPEFKTAESMAHKWTNVREKLILKKTTER